MHALPGGRCFEENNIRKAIDDLLRPTRDLPRLRVAAVVEVYPDERIGATEHEPHAAVAPGPEGPDGLLERAPGHQVRAGCPAHAAGDIGDLGAFTVPLLQLPRDPLRAPAQLFGDVVEQLLDVERFGLRYH